jgi:serine/threonine protein kinase
MLVHNVPPFVIFNPTRKVYYRAIQPLGAGGFGNVFAGVVSGHHVAIKVIRPTSYGSQVNLVRLFGAC